MNRAVHCRRGRQECQCVSLTCESVSRPSKGNSSDSGKASHGVQIYYLRGRRILEYYLPDSDIMNVDCCGADMVGERRERS